MCYRRFEWHSDKGWPRPPLAHADLAVRHDESNGEIAISPRRVLIEIRREMAGPRARPNQRSTYLQRLNNCRAATRQQRGLKATREWPRRKSHVPPKPPKFLTLRDDQKALLNQHLGLTIE